jgi:hypothetical protein
MRKTIIAAVLVLAACGDAKKQFDEGFKSSFEKSFGESCTTSAMNGGVPAEKRPLVVAFCDCVGKKLVERHSVTELASMGAGANKEFVQAAAADCKPQ